MRFIVASFYPEMKFLPILIKDNLFIANKLYPLERLVFFFLASKKSKST